MYLVYLLLICYGLCSCTVIFLVAACVLRLFTSKYPCLLPEDYRQRELTLLYWKKRLSQAEMFQGTFYSMGIWLFFNLYLLRVGFEHD